jgi:peptidoglycan-associated lipoprotein
MLNLSRRTLFIIAVALAASLGACARDPAQSGVAGGPGGPGGWNAPGSIQDFTSNVGDRIFFDTDSTELNARAMATLDKQAAWLARYPRYRILMEGHADERGTREYNFGLSARRGDVARDYLVARGIGAERIRTVSYGKERPVAVCNDISCWSQNRRAVTVLESSAGS